MAKIASSKVICDRMSAVQADRSHPLKIMLLRQNKKRSQESSASGAGNQGQRVEEGRAERGAYFDFRLRPKTIACRKKDVNAAVRSRSDMRKSEEERIATKSPPDVFMLRRHVATAERVSSQYKRRCK